MGNVPTPLSGFTRTGPDSFEYTPKNAIQSSAPSSPDLILICSWLDAEPRHIAKYTNGFKDLYPNSRILLTMTKTTDHIIRSAATSRKMVSPIVSTLISEPPESKILAAVYSGGGCITVCKVGSEFKARVGRPVPLAAMLIDSGPDVGTWDHVTHVPYAMPRNPVLRFLGWTAMYAWFTFEFSRLWLVGEKTPHELAREVLNDKSVFDPGMKRVYVCSDADQTCKMEFVKEHYEEARALGWRVEMERFVGSAHVGHMRVDPKRYWGIIRGLWEQQS